MTFQDLVKEELRRANEKHGPAVASAHEGYAIIAEEFDEYWDEVKNSNPVRRPWALKELVQVAAMCEKVATAVYGAELKALTVASLLGVK